MPPKPKPTEERLWLRVEKTETCWLWTGQKTRWGYGLIWDGDQRRSRVVHRVVWEILKGPIPEGLQLDHLCRVKLCVNPDHLEPVTAAENQKRYWKSPDAHHWRWEKTHCPSGHEFTPENTYVYAHANGRWHYRQCRTCALERAKAQKRRRREAKAQQATPFS